MGLVKNARIKAIQEIHSTEMTKKDFDLRDIALAQQSDKKASNLVSILYLIDKSLNRTTCSTSDLIFILLSFMYKVINQLYD